MATVALAGFVLQTLSLRALEWHDAYVTSLVEGLQQLPHASRVMAGFAHAAPYIGVAFVLAGVTIAWLRGARLVDVLWVVVLFALALVLVQLMKTIFERERPGAPPWRAGGDSFPSGHVANAALCVAAAVRLASSGRPRDGVYLLLLVAGLTFVPAVALTRVYLHRHWLTDATASALLGVVFWGISRTRPGRVAAAIALLLTLGLSLGAAFGGRIHLPSPSKLSERPRLVLPLRHLHRALAPGVGGTWVRAARGRRAFLRLDAPEMHLRVRVQDGRGRSLLKLVARPMFQRDASGGSGRIDVLIDGALVAGGSLRPRWRTYAFPLPELAPGWHDLQLRAVPARPGAAAGAQLALRELRIEDGGRHLRGAIAPVVARPHLPDAGSDTSDGRTAGEAEMSGLARRLLTPDVTWEEAVQADRLRRVTQELLDRWYPGTAVTIDWTGDAYLLQIERGLRLASPIWVGSERLRTLDDAIALRRQVIAAAWRLAAHIPV